MWFWHEIHIWCKWVERYYIWFKDLEGCTCHDNPLVIPEGEFEVIWYNVSQAISLSWLMMHTNFVIVWKYYIRDASFILKAHILTPYHGVGYHLKEYSHRGLQCIFFRLTSSIYVNFQVMWLTVTLFSGETHNE